MINGIVNVLDTNFKVSLPDSKVSNYGSGDYMKVAGVGSVIRQVLNQLKKDGKVYFDKLWIKTSAYSMGNSINIYLLNPTSMTTELVENLSDLFSTGSFNGMIDLYENTPSDLRTKLITSDGGELECNGKYIFVHDTPPFGSKEYDIMFPPKVLYG